MVFAHLRRLAFAGMAIFAVFVLALVIDAVAYPILEMGYDDFGVEDGPFGAVYGWIETAMWIPVPALLFGIVIWVLFGPVQQERREDRREVPPPR